MASEHIMASEEVRLSFIKQVFEIAVPGDAVAKIEFQRFDFQHGEIRTFDNPADEDYYRITECVDDYTDMIDNRETEILYTAGFQNKYRPQEVYFACFLDELPEGWRVEDMFKPSDHQDCEHRARDRKLRQHEYCWTSYAIDHKEDIFYVRIETHHRQ